MTEELATDLAKLMLEIGVDTESINDITKTLDLFGQKLRKTISIEIEDYFTTPHTHETSCVTTINKFACSCVVRDVINMVRGVK